MYNKALIDILATNISSLVEEDVGKTFGAPSIFFHKESIRLCRSDKFLSEEHIKSIYAGLCAWGMHRMGKTDTKLVDYDLFLFSILEKRYEFNKFRFLRIDELSEEEFKDILPKLTDLVFALKVSASSVNLVANTKTAAHILPDLVPFIDRRYTLNFLKQNESAKTINLSWKNERAYFEGVMKLLFDFSHDARIIPYFELHRHVMATSIPKIFDNCLIAIQKSESTNT